MKYRSSRKKAPILKFSETLQAGLASDGGLYVPESFPFFDWQEFKGEQTLASLGEITLKPFLAEDTLQNSIIDICQRAFSFSTPTVQLNKSTAVLELYHGPTAAFKDVGARFLAQCLRVNPIPNKRTVLVATSGDTGGAVAAAFHNLPGFEVIILFPKGLVSPFQEKQLTFWGGNVHAYGVRGNFDDCQRLVKEAFVDSWWKKNKNLISANSINIGRILPQTIYFALSSLIYLQNTGKHPGFIVPSGNLGNSLAALWAKKMGFPIKKVVMACNANRAVPDYFESGVWRPQPTLSTLANAMDVGNPSNMERIIDLYPHLDDLKKDAESYSVSDSEISQTIRDGKKKWKRIWCPHTAAAAFIREKLTDEDWIIVATAHPAKFQTVIEPLILEGIAVPATLNKIYDKKGHCDEIEPDLEGLKEEVLKIS